MIAHTSDAAATATAGTVSSSAKETVDGSLFSQELENRIADSLSPNARDLMRQTMERLAAAFPNSTITIQSMTATAVNYSDGSSISVSPDMLQQISEDGDLFTRTSEAVRKLFAAGKEQLLAGVPGNNVTRSISVTMTEMRYVETQRSASGTSMSVSSLLLEHQKMLSDTIDKLISPAKDSTGSNRGKSGSGSKQASGGFDSFLQGTMSWRFESFLTSQSLLRLISGGQSQSQSPSLAGSGQLLDLGQFNRVSRSAVSIEVTIKEWSESANGDVSGFDLLAYIQMAGLADPLVLDLGGQGIDLTSAEDGVYFDIRGDGSPSRTAFIKGDNAFLFLDENGNGVADDANELFGNHGGFADGYDKLAQYDDNGDGVIDANDAIYSQLRLWRDLNGDGISGADEVMTLAEAGIQSLNLRHDGSKQMDRFGNVIADRSTFTRTDGSTGTMADVWLRST